VYLHWRRQREDLGYLGGEREIDLVVNPERPELLVNVALSVGRSDTYEREIAGLEWAAVRMPGARRILIVQETPAREVPKGMEVIEAWRYLLDSVVESTTGAVVVGESQLLPPLSSGGVAIDAP
jgi:predicted AAA+ superfamily ATPase